MELKGVLKKRFQELNHDTPKHYTVEPFHIKYVRNDMKFQSGKEAIHQIGRVETCFTDPSFTQLEGEGVTAATVGQEAQFAVITKTNDGKVPTDPEDCVTVEIESPTASGHSKSIQANVTQHGNGRYCVTYTPTCCGEHKVHVWVNGEAITDSPRKLKVKKQRMKNKLSCQVYNKNDGPEEYKNLSPRATSRLSDHIRISRDADEPVEKGCGAETWSCDRSPSPRATSRLSDYIRVSRDADEPVEKGCGAETWSFDRYPLPRPIISRPTDPILVFENVDMPCLPVKKDPSPRAIFRPTDRFWVSKDTYEPVEKDCGAEAWSCDRCTYLNSGGVAVCDTCGSTRGVLIDPSSPSVKPCRACTFHNKIDAVACEMCDKEFVGFETLI